MGNQEQNAWIQGMVEVMVEEITDNPRDNWFNQNYHWPPRGTPQNEIQTVGRFKELSDALNCSFENIETLSKSMTDIVKDWGGIQNFNPAKYLSWISNLHSLQVVISNNPDQNIFRTLVSGVSGPRIPSWSKLLAAWKSGVFFIYDSRVSIALSHFCRKYNILYAWKLVNPRDNEVQQQEVDGTQFQRFKKKIQQYNREQNLRAEWRYADCYFRYHQLLHALAKDPAIQEAYRSLPEGIRNTYKKADFSEDQAIMAHIEKMLFMMKEKILQEYNHN